MTIAPSSAAGRSARWWPSPPPTTSVLPARDRPFGARRLTSLGSWAVSIAIVLTGLGLVRGDVWMYLLALLAVFVVGSALIGQVGLGLALAIAFYYVWSVELTRAHGAASIAAWSTMTSAQRLGLMELLGTRKTWGSK